MIHSIKVSPRSTEVIRPHPIDARALLKRARKLKAKEMSQGEARRYFDAFELLWLTMYYSVEVSSMQKFYRRHRWLYTRFGLSPYIPRLLRE